MRNLVRLVFRVGCAAAVALYALVAAAFYSPATAGSFGVAIAAPTIAEQHLVAAKAADAVLAAAEAEAEAKATLDAAETAASSAKRRAAAALEATIEARAAAATLLGHGVPPDGLNAAIDQSLVRLDVVKGAAVREAFRAENTRVAAKTAHDRAAARLDTAKAVHEAAVAALAAALTAPLVAENAGLREQLAIEQAVTAVMADIARAALSSAPAAAVRPLARPDRASETASPLPPKRPLVTSEMGVHAGKEPDGWEPIRLAAELAAGDRELLREVPKVTAPSE